MRTNLRFRRVAKLMLILCVISFSQNLDAKEIGPFGVYMGMTYAELRGQIEIEPLSGHKSEYLGAKAPISKVEFAAYIYTISPDVGLCRVTAISEAELEVEVLKLRDKIGKILERKYGYPQKKGESFVWRPSNDRDIQAVVLRMDRQNGRAGIRLGYIFSNFSNCDVAGLKTL